MTGQGQPGPQPRARLPKGAPQDLIDFVRCRRDRLALGPGSLDWLPRPPGVPKAVPSPSVSFEKGPGEGLTITVSWGFISLGLPANVTDGGLEVDTSRIPDLVSGLKKDIEKWVEDLNADLADQGNQVGGWSIEDGKLTAWKVALGALTTAEAAALLATGRPAYSSTQKISEPERMPPKDRVFWGFRTWGGKAAVGAGAVVLGVAAFFLFVDGDDPPVAADPLPTVATTTTSTTTTMATTTTAETAATTTAPPVARSVTVVQPRGEDRSQVSQGFEAFEYTSPDGAVHRVWAARDLSDLYDEIHVGTFRPFESSVVLFTMYGREVSIEATSGRGQAAAEGIVQVFLDNLTETDGEGLQVDWPLVFVGLGANPDEACGGRVVLEVEPDRGGPAPGFDAEGHLEGSGTFTGEYGDCRDFPIALEIDLLLSY